MSNLFSCSHPKIVHRQVLPCGHCIKCKNKRILEWQTRMIMENSYYNSNSVFITLTYDNTHLPTDKLLHKSDLQKFLKRLRYYINVYYGTNYEISYFACGEYGSQFLRPHFHLIIFNILYSKDFNDIVLKSWQKGFVYVKSASRGAFSYVSKYCVKEFNKVINGVSEFVLMSRKNAIGKRFLKNNEEKIIDSKGVIMVGKKKMYVPTVLIRRYLSPDFLKKRCCVYNIVVGDNEVNNINYTDAYITIARALKGKDLSEFIAPKYSIKFNFISISQFLNFIDLNYQKEKDIVFKSKNKLVYGDYYKKFPFSFCYIKRFVNIDKYVNNLKYVIKNKDMFKSVNVLSSFNKFFNIKKFYDKFKNFDLLLCLKFFYFKTYEYI